ncbi:MAG: hypothetical protein M5U14_01295 [Acidimicrobiia bacterium]|nr:hypothetical protein [Acidimicrobiia bacterium]
MEPAVKLAVVAAGVFFLAGLVTGAWKYVRIASSPAAVAPPYVGIAHRAALMYAFATLLLGRFAELSPWADAVDLLAVAAPVVYFAAAIGGYVVHGALDDTDNQFARPHRLGTRTVPEATMARVMWSLVVAEIGGFSVLFAGTLKTVLL